MLDSGALLYFAGPMVARMPIKQKLEKSHEKRIVRQRKVPNLAKNCKLQAKSGKDACRISHTHSASQCPGAAGARLHLRRATREGWFWGGQLTRMDVAMPLKTGEPISEKVLMRRSSREP
jgi:hypothetical protein